jgi:hypothetical protein
VSVAGALTATATSMRHRIDGTNPIDEWGLDIELIDAVSPLLSLRWQIDVEGADHVPARGGAALLFNRRLGLSEALVLARGLRLATGRCVRWVGAPDLAVAGPIARRFGGVLSAEHEVASLLRAGELVAVPLGREVVRRAHAGTVPPQHVAPIVAAGAAVVPAAVVGREAGRRWRVLVGEPLTASGKGPLALAELADRARRAVQDLLDAALPPRRFW